MICFVKSCGIKSVAKGLCWKHYARLRRTGTTDLIVKPTPSLEESYILTSAGCWVWVGKRNPDGYGQLCGKGAHRLAYETWVGPIPDGHVVRHKCDNPPCINPEHLETGTAWDNVADREARGRTSRGETHYSAKLTEQDVLDILCEYSYGVLTQQMLADVYGVGQAMISRIVRGSKWRHLTAPELGEYLQEGNDIEELTSHPACYPCSVEGRV